MTPHLTANRRLIDTSPRAFGRLTDSGAMPGDAAALRSRLEEDGYLYLSGLLDRELLLQIQQIVVHELLRNNLLCEPSTVRARPGVDFYGVLREIGHDERIRQISHLDPLVALFSGLFMEPARGLDFIWPRAAGPGRGEAPHCDWVYVGRGTRRLLTVWIPLMDIPITRGPLMIMEGSHRANVLTKRYLGLDADRLGFFGGLRFKHGQLVHGGRYSLRPERVQKEFGTRWLTQDFKIGDVVLFGPELMHATLDNQTDGFRLSIDTRFQPVSAPMDPRFVGARPEAHSRQEKSIIDYYIKCKRWLTGRDSVRRT